MTRRQLGFSIVELLVAVCIGLILCAGVMKVFIGSKQGYRSQEGISRAQESGRFATSFLSSNLRLADFWSGVKPSSINVLSGAVSGPAGATTCISSWILTVTGGTAGTGGVYGYDGGATPPVDCVAAADYVPNTDMIVVRYVDPDGYRYLGCGTSAQTTCAPTAACTNATIAGAGGDTHCNVTDANKVYVRTRSGRDAYVYQGDGAGASLADAKVPNGDGVFNYEYRFAVLFLRPCSTKVTATCTAAADNGNPIPSLVSLDPSGGALSQTPLADNVEQLQFEYGIDTDGNYSVDVYKKATDVAATEWPQVITVRATMIVRGDAKGEFADTQTYNLAGGYAYTPATAVQKYQRRLVVKDIQIRNRVRE